MKTRPSLWRRAIGTGAALAVVVGATAFVGCSDDDNPTDPGGGADPGLAMSGSGAGTLPRMDFQATNSFIGGGGGYFWQDDGTVPIRAGDIVELSIFPTGDVASSAGLTWGANSWTALGGVGGVTGIAIGETRVTFTDAELSDGATDIVLNGFLDIPSGTEPPATPLNPAVDGIDNGLFVSWDRVTDAVSYNVYYASDAGVTPQNYLSLANGDAVLGHVEDQARPDVGFAVPTVEPYFVVVTAVNAGGESLPSTEVSATPNDPSGPFGTLDVDSDGMLPSNTFRPLSSWPGNNNQAVYLWNDPNDTETVLAVNYDRTNDEIDNVYLYSSTSTWGIATPAGGVVGAMVSGSQFVFTNLELPVVDGAVSPVTISGTLDRGTTVFPSGTLVFNGDDVPAEIAGSFVATNINIVDSSAVLEFENSTSGTTVTVDIGGLDRVVSVVVESGDALWWTDFFEPPPPVLIDGNELGFTNIECIAVSGTTATAPIMINGSLFW